MLHVDLIGACFDILTKPVPLMQRHVDIFRHKVIMGIHNRQRKLEPSASLGVLSEGEKGFAIGTAFEDELEINNNEIPIDDPNEVVLHKEMLLEPSSNKRDVRVMEEFLDFNFAEFGRLSESRPITLVNNFPFEITVNWVLLKVENKKTGEMMENPFRITPAVETVGANQTATFQVRFGPYEPDSYFF